MSKGVLIKKIFADAITLPPMIRFRSVRIDLIDVYDIYNIVRCLPPIEERSNRSIAFLQQIDASAFNYSSLEIRGAVIENDYTAFHDHRQVVDYAKSLLIPFFNACSRIKLKINFSYDVNGAGDLFAQLLQLEPIMSCPDVEFNSSFCRSIFGNVPIDEIANWLCVKPRGRKNGKKITIYMDLISNGLKLIDKLKEVIFSV